MVTVGVADPVGVARLIPGLAVLREVAPGAALHVVANRVRRRSADARDFAEVVARHSNLEVAHAVADDADTLRAMTTDGLLPTELRGRSQFAADMTTLARLLGVGATAVGRPEPQVTQSLTGNRRLARIAS